MNFWERVTGSDLTRDWQAFETRAEALPDDYRTAWGQIKSHLFPVADFTGRKLTPILDAALGLLEEAAADGQSVHEVFGDDIRGFCAALVGGEGARTYRDRWREQLNRNVARKLVLAHFPCCVDGWSPNVSTSAPVTRPAVRACVAGPTPLCRTSAASAS